MLRKAFAKRIALDQREENLVAHKTDKFNFVFICRRQIEEETGLRMEEAVICPPDARLPMDHDAAGTCEFVYETINVGLIENMLGRAIVDDVVKRATYLDWPVQIDAKAPRPQP